MVQTEQKDDCVSEKPWGEVLARSLKLFTFNAAQEGGKSFGRVIFFVILAALALVVATSIIESMTGWFSSWFDFWPFNRMAEVAPEAEKQGWFGWGSDESVVVSPADKTPDGETKWYCKWNPVC